ncbi:MAG: glycosyltransferase family 39 protein [Verrucomicrobia bacterium]|nr:glycosyltransferase family 39 protein [Verrucomicrobiota bacterium]
MVSPQNSDAPAPTPPAWSRDLLLLLLAFGALYFFRIGSYPLSNPDEGRYAEIPREMLATGDWVTPRLNDVNYFEKPPLVYWVTAASEAVFGLNEWAVRAVPVFFALWGIALTYWAARRLHGREAGLASAVVLGTGLLWFAIGHIPLLDMAVSVLMAQALFCFIIGVGEPAGPVRRRLFYGLYVRMALATLTKGLIGFLVTGAVMFLWLLVFNQWKRLRPLHLPTGALLFLAIAAPWHVLAGMRNPTWVHRYFVEEHFERFTSDYASRPGPWHYFIWIAIAGMIPWTGFVWPAVRDALRGGWAKRAENATAWFLVTWSAFIFLFFSYSKSKLPPYILPIFPALATLTGAWLAQTVALADGAQRLRTGLRIYSFVNGLLAVALLTAVLKPGLIIRDQAQALALQWPAIAMAGVLLLGGIFVPWLAKTRGARVSLIGIVVTAALFLGCLQVAAPDINKPSTKLLGLYVKQHAKPDDRVFHCYDFYQDFTFYCSKTGPSRAASSCSSRKRRSTM